MPIDASKVTWDAAPAAPAIDINAVQWDTPSTGGIPGPRQTGFFTGLGRGLASLADVTVGGVLPTAVQQLGYPLARLGRSAQDAQATTQRLVSAVDRPFGKVFGVTETPEYQQEASRQLMDFVGQNFQKGAKWISEKTGFPVEDVENMLGSLSMAVPVAAKPIAQVTRDVVVPGVKLATEQTVTAVKKPFEKQLQARRERMSLEDYARGPQIDAAAEAQRLGYVLKPSDIQPTMGPRISTAIAGEKGGQLASAANRDNTRKVAINEMGLPETTQFDSSKPFDAARAQVAAPYEEVKKLPTMTADDNVRAALERLRPDESMIGSDKYAAAINHLVDDALLKTDAGLTGAQLLDNVQKLRQRARKTYNNKNADLSALDVADTNLAIANALESMIESNISNPKLLDQFRDARQKMARSYAYEGATDFNTGVIDAKKIARITSKDNALTGDIASIGKIAGNFPDQFTPKVSSPWGVVAHLGRTGLAGTLGGVAGYALSGGSGYLAPAVGSILGAGAGELGQRAMARRVVSPEYQAGLQLRDMRLPVNQLAATVANIPQNRAMVPYQSEVLGPSGESNVNKLRIVSYDENGVPVYAADPRSQGFTMPAQPYFGAAPTPYAQRSITNEVPQQVARARYEAQKRADLVQEFREVAERKPASREVILDINPLTGVPEISKGLKGATPETFQNFGTSLESAAAKATAGKSFDMTAAEKVAWNKTKVDLAEVMPGMKALDDKAIAAKMMDREWVREAVVKAKQKAQMQADIAARATTEKQRRIALAEREKMLDLAEQMEEGLRAARPVSRGGQGPKTRAHQRNMLNPDQEVLNQLLGK